jgi:hypothetical protein
MLRKKKNATVKNPRVLEFFNIFDPKPSVKHFFQTKKINYSGFFDLFFLHKKILNIN